MQNIKINSQKMCHFYKIGTKINFQQNLSQSLHTKTLKLLKKLCLQFELNQIVKKYLIKKITSNGGCVKNKRNRKLEKTKKEKTQLKSMKIRLRF